MTEPTSVRPELLTDFASTSQGIESDLETRIGAARRAVSSFLAATDPGLATAQPDLVHAGLTDIANRLADTRRFAVLLRDAVLAADVQGDAGVMTVTSAQLLAALDPRARSEFELLLQPTPLPPIDPPDVGAIPEDSGLVDDPVCTATGHFLEDELDLVVPDRVALLGWPRRYSSRQLELNAHGPGWWSWADVTCRTEGDEVVVVGPDGRHLRAPVPGAGPVGVPHADATIEATTAGGHVVRWGLRHHSGPESWHFDAHGRPHLVDSTLRGRVVLDHDDDGRLRSMAHEGGRSLDVDWDGDRIAAVRDSHGREVSFRYVGGHLVEVVRDWGDRSYATDELGRIVEVVDADGVTLARNRYDAEGRVVRQVAPTGRVTVFRYEPGRRTAVLDGAGEVIAVYVHDHRGRVEAMVSPHGAELTRAFDRDGRVTDLLAHDGSGFTTEGTAGPDGVLRITHHDGRVEQLEHDHLGRVVRHELVGEGATSFGYEGDAILPATITAPSGARRTMRWEHGGVLVGSTDPDGVSVELEVDGDGLAITGRNGAGHTVSVERAAAGAPTRVGLPDGGEVVADVDGAGRVRRITSPDGTTTSLEYTRAGRLAATSAPDGATATFRYGEHGFLVEATDGTGRTLEVDVDEWGRPTAVGAPGEGSWSFGWSALGVLAQVTTPGGARWHQELDEHHRVAGIVDPDGRTEELERTDGGRLAGVRHPGGEVRVTVDDAGRVDEVTASPGGRSSVTHDADGRPVEVVDGDGVRTRVDYTAAGRVAARRFGEDEAVTFDHDAAGLVAAVNHAGATWRVERDWRGEPTVITAPTGRQLRIERDALGRPVTTDRAGVRERWSYDRRGHVAAQVAPSGTTTQIRRDAVGRVVGVDGPGGPIELAHDPGSGTTLATDPLGGHTEVRSDADGHVRERTDPLARTTTFERAAGGALQAVVDADGRRLGFEHDDAGRVAAVYDDGTALARYTYDAGHLVEVEEPGSGRRTRFEVTPVGRVRTWRDEAGRHATVERDAAGRVVSRTGDLLPPATWTHGPRHRQGSVAGRSVSVELDLDGALARLALDDRALEVSRGAAGEVTTARWTDGRGEHHLELDRDGAGRVVRAELDGQASTYAYDEAGRLVAWERAGTRAEWDHDVAGRLVAEREIGPDGTSERRFRYDAAHQLVAVEEPEGTTEIRYDGAGRRIAERRPDGTVRSYEWDAIGRLHAVVDGDRRTQVDIDSFGRLRRVDGTELRWDVAQGTPELAAIGDEAVVASGPFALAVGDELLVDQLLGPAARGVHPFGSSPDDGSVTLACGLPGGVAFAGLVWLGDRILDPATGQFLSPDPLAATIGSPTQAFPYAYADGDPINRADPTGRTGQPISIADFEDARQRSMGPQWGNIATVAGVVAGVALAATGVGLVGLVIGGAVIGGVTAGAMSYQQTGSVDWGNVAIGAVFGGLGGAAGFGAGRAITPHITNAVNASSRPLVQQAGTSMAGRMFTGGAVSAVADAPVHLTQEAVTAHYNGRAFDGGNVAQAIGWSFVGGSLAAPFDTPTRPVPVELDAPTPVPSPMPQTPLAIEAAPTRLQIEAAPTRLQIEAAPTRLQIEAPAPRPAIEAPAPRPALPPPPSSSVLSPTPSLALPDPPTGFVQHSSGLYVPQ